MVVGNSAGFALGSLKSHPLTMSLTHCTTELELELIQTQMAQKPMLRVEVYARALRASQKRERERMCG